MRPLKHVFQGAFRIFKFILIYILSILLFLFIFSLVYSHYSIVKSYQFSFDIIWGNPTVPENLHGIVILQKMLYDIFLVFLIGTFISQQLRPINPIEYSKFIVYNKAKNCYSFRYWAILCKNKYLYNVTVRLILTTQEELNRGVNKLSTQFEKQDTYNSIRGVRYFKIDGEDATDFSRAINKGKNCIISLYILGTNESGITYSSVKRYGNKDIKNGYEFISIRKSEYEKQINNASFITQKNNFRRKRVANRDSFRYQHFDRICELDEYGKIKNTLPEKRNLPIKETVLNFVSWVISLVLDK